MKTILVTGGCGYIGSQTIIELIRQGGFNVVSIDNLSNSTAQTLDRIEEVCGVRITNHAIDLCDDAATEDLFGRMEGVLGVIHFAALKSVPDSVREPLLYYKNNLRSLTNVLNASIQNKIPNLIFSSSCSVYGNATTFPVRETTPWGKPESPYAATKQMGEQIVQDVASSGKIRCMSLRYFNPVGADVSGKIGEDPLQPPTNLAPIITRTAVGLRPEMTVHGGDYSTRDGSCVRDYIHVSDIARAHVRALEFIGTKTGTFYDVLNLGTGRGSTVLEVIRAFERATGVAVPFHIGPRREGDVVEIYSDNTKTESLLGWKPCISLDEMMLSAWKWQCNQPMTTKSSE